jgi:hypothetical protein
VGRTGIVFCIVLIAALIAAGLWAGFGRVKACGLRVFDLSREVRMMPSSHSMHPSASCVTCCHGAALATVALQVHSCSQLQSAGGTALVGSVTLQAGRWYSLCMGWCVSAKVCTVELSIAQAVFEKALRQWPTVRTHAALAKGTAMPTKQNHVSSKQNHVRHGLRCSMDPIKIHHHPIALHA